MSAMLDSDLANPNYVGAQNPDRMIHVQFKKVPVLNGFKTEQEKRPIYDTVELCVMTPPGGLISVPEILNEGHKQRFPFQWAQYQNSQGQGPAVQGTPIDEWPAIEVGMRETLKAQKFYTVEQIAHASDLQLQAIGMAGRMLQQKAEAYLQAAAGTAAVAEKDARIAALEEQVKALMEKRETLHVKKS